MMRTAIPPTTPPTIGAIGIREGEGLVVEVEEFVDEPERVGDVVGGVVAAGAAKLVSNKPYRA